MKRTLIITMMLVAFTAAITLSVAIAADAPAKDVAITFPGEKTKYNPTVMFSHTKHAAVECADCHHKMAESKDMKCSGCHSDFSKENKKKPESFDSAWHNKKAKASCVGCHKTMKQGPTKCNDCHTKKKK